MSDFVFPLVFPDYLIAVPRPSVQIDLPDFLPFDEVIEDILDDKTTKVPELGHAGVLFIGDRGNKGITKYYEYGRYRSNRGETRRRPMPDCDLKDGKPEFDSLKRVFRHISTVAGQQGRVSGVSIEVPGKYQAMLSYCKERVKQNTNPGRRGYSLIDYSCVTFVQDVVQAAGVEYSGSILDARPISYIDSLQSDYPDIEYAAGQLTLETEEAVA
jgi:hypothetical protein